MRRLVLLLALLSLPSMAAAQVAKRPSAVGPDGVSSVAITAPGVTQSQAFGLAAPMATTFAWPSPGCVADGASAGTLTTLPLSVARNGTGIYAGSSGTLGSCAANQGRVASTGLISEASFTNAQANPDTFTAWTKTGTTAVTADQADGPDGAHTADLISFPSVTATNMAFLYTTAFTGTAAPWTFSIWARSVSGTVNVPMYFGTGTTATYSGACSVGTTWTRCSLTSTLTAASWYAILGYDCRAGTTQTCPTSAVQFYASRAMVHPGSYPHRYTATALAPELVAVPSRVLGSLGSTGSITFTPEWGSATAGADRTVLSASGFSIVYVSGSTLFRITAGGATADSPSQTFSAGSTHRIHWRYSIGGNVCFAVDSWSEACSSGTVAPFVPTQLVYLGGESGGDLDVGSATFVRLGEPASWPTNSKIVATLGDSITYGLNVTTPYPSTLQTGLGATYLVLNSGIAGNTTTQMQARWRSALSLGGAGRVVVLGGINDALADATSAAIIGRLTSIYEEVRAQGGRPIPVTILPFKGYVSYSAPREAVRVAVNAAILAYCSSKSITCVDAAADLDDGTGALKSDYDSGDHIHPNQAGADRLAALVQPAIP